MRALVLEQLAKLESVSHVFVLTYNVDLLFIERWVVPALRRCGHPTLTVIADASCAADAFARQGSYASRLGRRYRVAPLPLAGAAFHPKAIFAASDRRATLFVGSGNTSFGGWCDNAEVWTRYDSDAGGAGEIAAFRAFLDEVVGNLLAPEPVIREIAEATQGTRRPWATTAVTPSGLVGRVGVGPSLLERVRPVIGVGGVDELIIAAPYYDPEVDAARELANAVGARDVGLLVPGDGSTLTREARDALDPRWRVEATRVLRGERQRSAFVHAKWYAFVRGDRASVMVGSANASRAAWTTSGRAGNAELLAVREMSLDEMRATLLAELTVGPEPPTLPDAAEVEDEAPNDVVYLAVARYDRGKVRVSWRAPVSARVVRVTLDGGSVTWRAAGEFGLEVDCELVPRRVTLSFAAETGTTINVDAWIDDERELATSARERKIVDLVDQYASDGDADLSGWMAILEPFEAELREAAAVAAKQGTASTGSRRAGDVVEYEWSDVFPATPEDASRLDAAFAAGRTGRGRAAEIRSILLGALDALLPHQDDDTTSEPDETNSDDDAPTRERRVAKADAKRTAPPPVSAAAAARAAKTVKRATDALVDPRLLANRPGRLLQRDVTILATMLRVARREGWIDEMTFAQLSTRALTTLLIAGEVAGKSPLATGWLEERRRREADGAFVGETSSTSFVATLCAWLNDAYDAADASVRTSIEQAGLAAFTSTRWLFERARVSGFSGALARSIAIASAGDPGDAWQRARHLWRRWDRSARALLRLHAALRSRKVAEWRAAVPASTTVPGELVYTGKMLLGVVRTVGKEGAGTRVVVVPLSGGDPITFDGNFVVPVAAVAPAVGAEADGWLNEARATIDRLGSLAATSSPSV